MEKVRPHLCGHQKFRIPFFYALGTVLVFLILVLRQKSVLFRAEFWAEDGFNFFPDALHYGWRSLFMTHTQYHSLLSRIFALFTSYFPVLWTPYLYVLLSALFASLTLIWFAREGFSWIIPSKVHRLGVCFLLAIVPGGQEAFLSLCNLHSVSALFALVLLLERPHDQLPLARGVCFVFLFLNSPESIVLMPLILTLWFRTGNFRWAILAAFLLAVAVLNYFEAMRQVDFTTYNITTRLQPILMISILLESLINRSILSPILGPSIMRSFMQTPAWLFWPLGFLSISGTIYLFRNRKTSYPTLFFLIFVALCVNGTFPLLASSRLHPGFGIENLLRQSGELFWSLRYAFFPTAAGCLLWAFVIIELKDHSKTGKGIAMILALAMTYNFAYHYRRMHWRADLNWPQSAQKIQQALDRKSKGELKETIIIDDIKAHPNLCCVRLTVSP